MSIWSFWKSLLSIYFYVNFNFFQLAFKKKKETKDTKYLDISGSSKHRKKEVKNRDNEYAKETNSDFCFDIGVFLPEELGKIIKCNCSSRQTHQNICKPAEWCASLHEQ